MNENTPMTPAQQLFAEEHHNLVYAFLNEKKLPEDEALTLAYRSIQGGARGLDMGRNIFQSNHPVEMAKAIRMVSPAVSASPPLHGARWRAAWQTTSAIRHLPSVQRRRSASMLLWTMPACLCPICSPQRMRAFWIWRPACCSTIWAGICPAVI